MRKEGSQKEASGLSAGLDEVGAGPVAGPLVIAVAVFPTDMDPIPGVTDSKKLTEERRAELAPIIASQATFVGYGWASAQEIDDMRMKAAWQLAAYRALEGAPVIDHLYIDGVVEVDPYDGYQETVIKGDLKIWQVGAASIVAKVARDIELMDMAGYYPQYCWEKNKGYGTQEHRRLILAHGPCPYHRMSFLKKLKKQYDKAEKKEKNEDLKVANARW